MFVDAYPSEMMGRSNFLLMVLLGNGVVDRVSNSDIGSSNGASGGGGGGGDRSYEFCNCQAC